MFCDCNESKNRLAKGGFRLANNAQFKETGCRDRPSDDTKAPTVATLAKENRDCVEAEDRDEVHDEDETKADGECRVERGASENTQAKDNCAGQDVVNEEENVREESNGLGKDAMY